MARGNLTLHLSPAVQQAITSNTSQTLWDAIKDCYGVVSMPCIYKDFKEAISICFNPNQHPMPQFKKMAAAFACLGAVTVRTGANQTTLAIKPQLQALIVLSTLPSKWENLVPIICAGVTIADLKLDDVASQVIGQFETETNCGQHKSVQTVQKISTVKHKHGDPCFTSRKTSSSTSSSLLPLDPPTSSSLIGSTVDEVPVRAKARASNMKVLLSTLTLPLSPHSLPQPPIKSYILGHWALQSKQSQRLLL